MTAGFRVQLKLKMVVGPLHPSAKADVYLTAFPVEDGTARVDITRIVFPNNALFSFASGFLKERLTEEINHLVRSAILDIPKYMPQVEEVRILEIENE